MNKIILVLLFAIVNNIYTQENASVKETLIQEANDFFQNKDWEKSLKAYQKIIEANPKDAKGLFRYGLSLHNLGKSNEAIPFIKQAIEISNPNAIMPFYLATAYAGVKDYTSAYKELDKIVSTGFIKPEDLTEEKAFDPLKQEEKFKTLVTAAELAANPCKSKEEFRQLDFWVGEWIAKTPQGFVAGESSVQKILEDCVILENWSSSNMEGKSFNLYDVTDQKWHQTWVDSKGNLTEYTGEYNQGKMVYYANEKNNGKELLLRLTFSKLPDNTIKQFAEDSEDEGKTWRTRYELIYYPKE